MMITILYSVNKYRFQSIFVALFSFLFLIFSLLMGIVGYAIKLSPTMPASLRFSLLWVSALMQAIELSDKARVRPMATPPGSGKASLGVDPESS